MSRAEIAVNTASGFAGNLLDLQVAGVSKMKVTNNQVIINNHASETPNSAFSDNALVVLSGTQSVARFLRTAGQPNIFIGTNSQVPNASGFLMAIRTGAYFNTASPTRSGDYGVWFVDRANDWGAQTSTSALRMQQYWTTDGNTARRDMSLTPFATESTGKSSYLYAQNLSLAASYVTEPTARLQVQGIGATSATYTAQFNNSTGSNNALVIRDDGNVGIGITTPESSLHVVSPIASALIVQRYGGIASIVGRSASGTSSAPTPSSGFITSLQGEGYDGASYAVGGRIYIQASETWTPIAHGTKLRFQTVPTGSTTVWDRMTISALGNVDIGATGGSDNARLIIGSNGTNTFSSWTTSGVALQIAAATYTDTSSTGGSTIATRAASSFASPTFASTNAITITNASTLFVASPVAGSNVIITNNKPIDTQTTAYLSSGGTWTNASSQELKENFTALDPNEVLEKIDSLRIEQWNYKAENSSITHIGPVAEEFHAAFNTGGTDGNKAISTIDPAGVALVGIQGLSAKLKTLLDLSWIIEGLKQFGVEISQELTKIKSLAVEKLQVGSAVEPSGFVMYDEDTKEPYCIKIKSGEFIKTPGDCDDTPTPVESQSDESDSEEPEQVEEVVTEPTESEETAPAPEETIQE